MTTAMLGGRLLAYGRQLGHRGRRVTAYGRGVRERAFAGDRRALLQVSGVCAVGFLAVYGMFVLTHPGQWLDAQAFGLAQSVVQGPLASWVPKVGRQALPPFLAAAALVHALMALVRGRWREVLFSSLTITTSTALSPVLRLLVLERPDYGWLGYPHNTLPSTHMAAVSSLLVAVVVLWSPPRRPWVLWTAAALAGLAAAGNVVGYAHLPSDVLGSVLLVGAVSAFTAAVSGLPQRRLGSSGQGVREAPG